MQVVSQVSQELKIKVTLTLVPHPLGGFQHFKSSYDIFPLKISIEVHFQT